MKMKYDSIGRTIAFKFLVLGEGRIGKTCLIERYVSKSFKENYIATIGMDIRTKRLEINNTDINISITDTAGQERFRSLTKMFYKGADGILVGFDLTDPNTLEQVNYWIQQIDLNKSRDYPISLILFGNKCDCEKKVKDEDINKIIDNYKIPYFETSAKDGTNVQKIFEHLTKITLKSRGFLARIGLPAETPIEEINIIEKENQKIEFKKIPSNNKKKKEKCC